MDVPLFASTEAAEAYGRALPLGEFPTLVRTYFVTQKAMAALENNGLQAKADLANRSQTLRQAIEIFLEISAAGHAAQGEPARAPDIAHETATADPPPEDGFASRQSRAANPAPGGLLCDPSDFGGPGFRAYQEVGGS